MALLKLLKCKTTLNSLHIENITIEIYIIVISLLKYIEFINRTKHTKRS